MKKVPQIAQWQVPRRRKKLKHLPTSLPYCLSWQTSDLGLSEWEQLKLVAWLDLASQDQVTAASRSSKPVHPKHGHLVPTPGDWWPVPAVRAAKRRSRSCWMNRSHSAADRVLSASSSSARGPTLPETRGRWPALPKQSFHAFSGLSARESCLSVAALYCRMCVIRKSFSHAPHCLKPDRSQPESRFSVSQELTQLEQLFLSVLWLI